MPRFRMGYKILLMGMTGSGKSTFVESLHPDGSLRISGNSLESVTDGIHVYIVNGIRAQLHRGGTCGVYLIDTPGFSDNALPETQVVRMIKESMAIWHIYVEGIIYFDRITDIRLGNTKKQSMELFKAVSGIATARNITIATSMWDQLPNQSSQQRAQDRFEEHKTGQWKAFLDAGSILTKFENTLESTLMVLKDAISPSELRVGQGFYEIERSPESIHDLESELARFGPPPPEWSASGRGSDAIKPAAFQSIAEKPLPKIPCTINRSSANMDDASAVSERRREGSEGSLKKGFRSIKSFMHLK